jgi:hypothetical protein
MRGREAEPVCSESRPEHIVAVEVTVRGPQPFQLDQSHRGAEDRIVGLLRRGRHGSLHEGVNEGAAARGNGHARQAEDPIEGTGMYWRIGGHAVAGGVLRQRPTGRPASGMWASATAMRERVPAQLI